MPTINGECPLGKFKEDSSCPGTYTADPVEECFHCNFANKDQKDFDLEKICTCPSDIDWDEYDRLRKAYAATGKDLTKQGFQNFVKENYRK